MQCLFAIYKLMAYLLDTNVLSELRRPRPDPKVIEFVAGATS